MSFKTKKKSWNHKSDCIVNKDGRKIRHVSTISKTEWKDDMKTWPEVKYKDIFNYFVLSEGVDGAAMENWKSMESWKYFQAGKVETVFSHQVETDLIYLKAQVTPSQAVNNKHTAWVLIQANGIIQTAGCTCIAGMGKSCSHAGAVLWKLEHATESGWCGKSCTDQQQVWNKGTARNIEPCRLEDISFERKRKNTRQPTSSPGKHGEAPMLPNKESLQAAAEKSSVSPLFQFGMLGSAMKAELTAASPPAPCQHSEHYEDKVTCKVCKDFYDKYVTVDSKQQECLEEQSRGQASSQLWRDLRRCRITGSTAKRVPVRKGPENFLREHLYPHFKGNASTKHGRDSEPIALRALEQKLTATFATHGAFVSLSEPWLAASPDGILDDTIVEIKCPVLQESETLEKKLVKGVSDVIVVNEEACLKESGGNGYFKQVQLTMFCTGKHTCKYFVWTPKGDILLDIQYNAEYVQKEVKRLKKFYFLHMLPRLASDFQEGRFQLCKAYNQCLGVSLQ